MKHTFSLIKNRIHNLEASIKQLNCCIEHNYYPDSHKDILIKVENELVELTKEYELLKQYCIEAPSTVHSSLKQGDLITDGTFEAILESTPVLKADITWTHNDVQDTNVDINRFHLKK